MKKLLILTIFLFLFSCTKEIEKEIIKDVSNEEKQSLVIFWTSGDPEVFDKVVFPYGLNSKKQDWWKDVELLIWGPSTKLLSQDKELQSKVKKMKETGVNLTSCLWCADQYEATDILRNIGVDVKYMGKPLTDYLQEGRKVITF